MSMRLLGAALAITATRRAAGTTRRVRLVTPLEGEHVVSDRLLISAIFFEEHQQMAHHASYPKRSWIPAYTAPSETHRLCIRINAQSPSCWSDHGPYGSLQADVFAVFVNELQSQSPPVHLVRAWIAQLFDDPMESMLKAETSGMILRNHFTLNTFRECAAAALPATLRRRVFDVFPFFGGHELDILEMRLHELGSVVDVFVPVEARLTHSGLPKPLNWAERGVDEHRFANFTVRGFEANLSQMNPRVNWAAATGDLNLAREEKQRDTALEALIAAGATADDLVIIADADEIASAAAIEAIKICDRDDAMLPTALEMTWFLYSFKWRARHRWGLFAREGAVVVSARMLGIGASNDHARSATAWRRQFRDRILAAHGGSRARVLADAGWHVSSFGGSDAVAAKLASYIGVSEYGSDFYKDAERLDRLADSGMAYYELAGYKAGAARLFECRDDDSDDDLPRLARKFWSFHAQASCDASSSRDVVIEADVVEARRDAAAHGHFVLGGWTTDDGSFAKRRVFEPRLKCRRFDTDMHLDQVYIRTELEPQCDEQGLTHSACDQAVSMLIKQCEAQLRATSLFYGSDQPTATELQLTPSISFEETTAVPITVDGHTTHLSLSAADNVDDLANRTCFDFHIPLDQCRILVESLRSMQPAKAWLSD